MWDFYFRGAPGELDAGIDAKLLKAAKRLKVIGRAGVGLAGIDVETATAQGVIAVMSAVAKRARLSVATAAAGTTMGLVTLTVGRK